MGAPRDMPVPFGRDGSLLRTAENVYEWHPNEPFRRTLTLRPRKGGGSRAYVTWEDAAGCRFPMFTIDLIDLLSHSTVSRGVTVGWWTITKRGSAYGICRLRVDDTTRS